MLDKNKPLNIPIAHKEGRYYASDADLASMRQNHQILFRYCDKEGEISLEVNPNGSVENIAGVCNEMKNIFGLMPHPERACDDELGNLDGKIIFESFIRTLREKRIVARN